MPDEEAPKLPAALVTFLRDGDLTNVRRLIDGGADARAKDKGGATPMLYAAAYGRLDIGRYLVDAKGADLIHATNNDGWTPLMVASYWGHLEFVSFLVIKGANIDAKNEYGETAHEWTQREKQTRVGEFLMEVKAAGDYAGWQKADAAAKAEGHASATAKAKALALESAMTGTNIPVLRAALEAAQTANAAKALLGKAAERVAVLEAEEKAAEEARLAAEAEENRKKASEVLSEAMDGGNWRILQSALIQAQQFGVNEELEMMAVERLADLKEEARIAAEEARKQDAIMRIAAKALLAAMEKADPQELEAALLEAEAKKAPTSLLAKAREKLEGLKKALGIEQGKAEEEEPPAEVA